MLRLGECLPNRRRRVRQVADENERPVLSILSHLGTGSWTRCVLLGAAHVFFLPFTEDRFSIFSIFSRCCSRASTCLDQKRRKGASHASSSMSGSGLSL